jgi:hypothetical protein
VQDAPAAATPPIYAGLFLVTLATLMYEVLLTRIFSVTMWYHFAFMAISVALFGMTVGALAVYVVPSRFPRDRVAQQLAWNALLFAAAIVASFTVHANIPVHGGRYALAGVLVPTYIVTAVPFALSGVCVTLALTRFPGQVSSLYAVDLAGAAAGCLLLIPLLGASGGPTAVIVIAAVAGIAAVLFAAETHSAGLKRRALASTIVLALLAAGNGVLAAHHAAPLRLTWVKGEREAAPIYEKWNSFSRIAVTGTPAAARAPIGWGLSAALPRGFAIPQLALTIDGGALTVITRFDGNLRRLEYLKYDVTNIAHYIRSDARVLVVGAGGGRISFRRWCSTKRRSSPWISIRIFSTPSTAGSASFPAISIGILASRSSTMRPAVTSREPRPVTTSFRRRSSIRRPPPAPGRMSSPRTRCTPWNRGRSFSSA